MIASKRSGGGSVTAARVTECHMRFQRDGELHRKLPAAGVRALGGSRRRVDVADLQLVTGLAGPANTECRTGARSRMGA